MDKIRLGRTGLLVSRIAFGGIPIQRLSESVAVAVVNHAIECGITFIDTAIAYSTSEERIGKAIAGRREQLVIATKTHAKDAAAVAADLATSLRRLAVNYIDIYQMHGVSSDESFEQVFTQGGAYEAMLEAKREGKIRYIGASSHSTAIARRLVESDRVDTIQVPFNFLADEAARDVLPAARRLDVGFIAMKPMAGGIIDNGRLALKYVLQFPDVVPDPGMQEIWEIDQAVEVAEGSPYLTVDEEAEIQRLRQDLGSRFCHRCDYCQPCPEAISISTVLAIESSIRRMPSERIFSEDFVRNTMLKALDCQECGECETRCPYELPIREMLQPALQRYQEARAEYLTAMQLRCQ